MTTTRRREIAKAVLGDLPSYAFSLAVFLVGPAVCAYLALTSPWRAAGIPVGIALLLLAVWGCAGLVSVVRARLGLRLVPQFERPLAEDAGTYFTGHRLLWGLAKLDEAAPGRPLSSFLEAAQHGSPWHPPDAAVAAVGALLLRGGADEATRRELETLRGALRRAANEGVSFRLVVVLGTTTSAPHWEDLRKKGY